MRAFVVAALALAGCGKQAAEEAPSAPRPSQGEQASMPADDPAETPPAPELVASGKALFDQRCRDCHDHGGTGGHTDAPATRDAPMLWNAKFWQHDLFDDGRAESLEAAIKTAGTPTDAEVAALATYVRTITCRDTKYDRYALGDHMALSGAEQRGLDLFEGKGRCATCHAPPYFSTAMSVDGGVYFNIGIGTQHEPVDVGRAGVSKHDADWAAFKPPSLRGIGQSAPYFHDGSAATLEDAVKFMSSGGLANKNHTPLLEDAKLADGERADLIDFLHALDCQ